MFELSSILWTSAIAYTLFRLIVKKKDSNELMNKFYVVCFGIPFLFCLLPLTTDSYGNTVGWCWIDPEDNEAAGQTWRLLLFYLPLWSAIGFNAYVYYIVSRAIGELFGRSKSAGGTAISRWEIPPKYEKLIRRLRMYPLILVFCWFFATINRVQNLFAPGDPSFALFFVTALFRGMQGMLNALVYGFNPLVRSEWVKWLSSFESLKRFIPELTPEQEQAAEKEGYDDDENEDKPKKDRLASSLGENDAGESEML
jgi:hypothetical protein